MLRWVLLSVRIFSVPASSSTTIAQASTSGAILVLAVTATDMFSSTSVELLLLGAEALLHNAKKCRVRDILPGVPRDGTPNLTAL